MPLLPGEQVKNYVVGSLVGQGGLGEVYQAFNAKGERVALKVIRADLAHDPQLQSRFVREIRLMQAVIHDNIVPILDFGAYNNTIFMVMKFINGTSLLRLMKRQPFSPQAAWHIIRDIAPAIEAGHQKNIIHRDLKPDNILVEGHGKDIKFYLSDFGLAKRPGIDGTLTEAGTTVGTYEYLPPEMATSSETADAQSDIYSFGITVYQLLCGKLPFEADNIYQMIKMHVSSPPPPLTTKHPDFPPTLEAVVLKALAKSPQDRFATILDFARAYYDVLIHLPEEVRTKAYW